MGLRTNTAKWRDDTERWQIKVQKEGIRRTFNSSIPGKDGLRDCHAKADAWLDENIVSPNAKVSELFDGYISDLEARTGRGHSELYKGIGKNWIKPRIGKKKICHVTEQDGQDIINAAYKKGRNYKTLQNILACFTAFIKYCRKCKATVLIIENVIIPSSALKKEKVILQPDDITKLFENDTTIWRGKPMYEILVNAWRFEVVTGLRPGEVIGLKWEDISNNITSIKRSINKYSEETSGKNDNAQRDFALTHLAKQIIQRQKLKMIEIGLRSVYVFPFTDGDHIHSSTNYHRWVRYRDYHDLSKSDLYGLRHTFVSMVKTLPEGVVKSLVGHSVKMDTFGTYGHEIDGELEENAQLVQQRFEKILEL